MGAGVEGSGQPSWIHTYLECGPRLDEVLLQDIVERRVEFLADVFNDEGTSKRQRILQVSSEILVVQGSNLVTEQRRGVVNTVVI